MSTFSRFPAKLSQRASSFSSNGTKYNGPQLDDTVTFSSQSHLRIIDEFREQIRKGVSYLDFGALSGIIDAIRHNNAIDDRKMLLEHVLVFLSRLPEGTLSTKLQNATVELLYLDLPHPPSSYIGNEYAYRTADGSGNNLSDPNMGKAGTPYARSVQQIAPLPVNELPDPGLIFDTLLRRDDFVKHPAGLSSMMFSFAAMVIHTVFRTSHDNVNINETSSYVDLAPLYGSNQDAQNKVRMRNGRGWLHPDSFAEDRLLLLPPAVCVLLVLFSRNHNYIASKLLEINERGGYVDPDTIPTGDPKRSTQLLQQEEELFQTARLINCAWFGSAVFSDYFSAILGLVRDGSNWSLNPFGEIRKEDHSLFERGRGNVCSVEFNCLYRWHATTSQHDEKWVEQLTAHLFGDKPVDEITMQDLKTVMKQMQDKEPDCTHWTFGNMQRQADGTFKDEELAAIIQAATDHPAGAFRARGTPHIMRLHEIMGITANRTWGCCSLNDFRKFLGLKPYSSFIEWNNDPDVAHDAEKLYGHIDRLELYVGLQAEQAKPVVEGAGLCPAYTISRAILADAIALTRGDRFFTADYTPYNMTAWGFADCQRDPAAPGYGSTLGRLFMRTLPNNFSANSTYTWFPLMTPDAMKVILNNLNDEKTYDLSKPLVKAPIITVSSYRDVAQVLGDREHFGPAFAGRTAYVLQGKGFYISSSDPLRAEQERHTMLDALTGGDLTKICQFFFDKTKEQMLKQSWTGVGNTIKNVDVVRDVLKFIPVHWAAEVAGIKIIESGSEEGAFTVQDLFAVLSEIYEYLFLDFEAYRFIPLSQKVKSHIDMLLNIIKSTYGQPSPLSISGIVKTVSRFLSGGVKTGQDDLTARFQALGYEPDTLANSVLALVVGSVELSQALVHVVDACLADEIKSQVVALANTKLAEAQQQTLEGYVLEALRLDPAFAGAFRVVLNAQETVGTQSVKQGQEIFADIAQANLDPDVFPDPQTVKPDRMPRDRYLVGDGGSKALGKDLSTKVMAEVLRGVFSYPNIRRAPGNSGILKRFKADFAKTSTHMYLDPSQKPSAWATSMVLQFD